MKVFKRIAIVLSFSVLVLLSCAGTALAQFSENSVSILSDIIVPILVIIDRLLDVWVNAASGNTLTDPYGLDLVKSLATIIQHLATFYAQFSLLLPANNVM